MKKKEEIANELRKELNEEIKKIIETDKDKQKHINKAQILNNKLLELSKQDK